MRSGVRANLTRGLRWVSYALVALVAVYVALAGVVLSAMLAPPERFAEVRFANYLPDPAHPSQAEAKAALERFAASLGPAAATTGRWGRRSAPAPRSDGRPGRYLDGGFGDQRSEPASETRLTRHARSPRCGHRSRCW